MANEERHIEMTLLAIQIHKQVSNLYTDHATNAHQYSGTIIHTARKYRYKHKIQIHA